MPEIRQPFALGKSGFTYSACGPSTKNNKETIDLWYNY